jgi:hypothetical protein
VKRYFVVGCLLLAAGGFGRGLAQTPASAPGASGLEKRIASVLPTQEEDRWLQIPWRTNVMEAVTEAGRAGKPVMLWVMNGNPLGCA